MISQIIEKQLLLMKNCTSIPKRNLQPGQNFDRIKIDNSNILNSMNQQQKLLNDHQSEQQYQKSQKSHSNFSQLLDFYKKSSSYSSLSGILTTDRKHTCSQCSKSFLKNAHLLRHIEQRHKQNRSFICQFPECGKNFKRDSHLRRHIISHTHEKNYKCQQCVMSFGYKHHLDRHIKTIHQKQLIKCDQCDIGFVKRKSLTRHIQTVHKLKGNKNKNNKTIITQNSQQNSQIQSKINKVKKITKQQKDKKLYRCVFNQCISAFPKKHQLQQHLKTKHKVQDFKQIFEQSQQKNKQDLINHSELQHKDSNYFNQ